MKIIRVKIGITLAEQKIGYSYLKINNMLRFKYPVGSFFVFINAGMSNGIAIREKNYKKEKAVFYTSESIDEEKAIKETRKYEQGFLFGTGSKLKKLFF